MRSALARRGRREKLAAQICFVGAALLGTAVFSNLASLAEDLSHRRDGAPSGPPRGGAGGGMHAASSRGAHGGRRLLSSPEWNATSEEEEEKNCTEPGIHEFPEDIFNNVQRRHGAVLLHVLCTMYMFYALAIVCDDFFVPSLEKICERLHLDEDVAGATFMAAGSSAPELFTSIIGVFITKGDVGVGTIVGSAVFNILCIVGVCGIFAGQVVCLTWWPICRDSVYYTFSVIALILFIYDEKVVWWEAVILVTMYVIYIVLMKFNMRLHAFFSRLQKGGRNTANGVANSNEMEDVNPNHVADMCRSTSVLMVDELLSVCPHKLDFSEAGLRIMITNHFRPRTRLRMASRMLINERQRLLRGRGVACSECEVAHKIQRKYRSGANASGGGGDAVAGATAAPANSGGGGDAENGAVSPGGAVVAAAAEVTVAAVGNDGRTKDGPGKEGAGKEGAGKEGAGCEEEEEDDEGVSSPCVVPDGYLARFKWLVSWPLALLLYLTVPNVAQPRWESWFMATFILSTLWIAIFSYVMVWMVTIIGYTLGIPDVIMGITFLAAGTSVPDCMASLIVARQGLGDMAVSNSIGSNVFDILVGLGFPWALQTLAVNHGSQVAINSRGLVYSVILLLASVFMTVLAVGLNKWRLDKKLGLGCLLLYVVFISFSILIEFNVFTFVNLPTCREK
ncbi:sodium/potassium/calcium exchanger 3-like [Lampetra fluviatilis]